MSRGFRNPHGVTQLPDLLHCINDWELFQYFSLFFIPMQTSKDLLFLWPRFHCQSLVEKYVYSFIWKQQKARESHDSDSGVTSSSCGALKVQNCSKEEMWLRNGFKTKLKLKWKGMFYCPLVTNLRCNIYRNVYHGAVAFSNLIGQKLLANFPCDSMCNSVTAVPIVKQKYFIKVLVLSLHRTHTQHVTHMHV